MFSERIAKIREKIDESLKRSGRKGEHVEIVAVSKYYPVEAIKDAYAQGHRVFGESRVQEAMDKKDELDGFEGLKLHFIGHLQTNKVKYLKDTFELIHSVDSERLAEELNTCFAKTGRVQDILIQVNIAGDVNKSGVDGQSVFDLCERVAQMKNLRLRGLMMIPPLTDDEEKNRKYFTGMKKLFDQCTVDKGYSMDILSMGMSDDFQIAVEEGSTMVRIGSALFKGDY